MLFQDGKLGHAVLDPVPELEAEHRGHVAALALFFCTALGQVLERKHGTAALPHSSDLWKHLARSLRVSRFIGLIAILFVAIECQDSVDLP